MFFRGQGENMPIYEYRCSACGHEKEVLQRISDKPLAKCPECGKRSFKKLVSAAGFQLKGTGWYATDFKNKGTKPAAKAASSDKAAESAKPAESAAKETAKAEKSGSAGASTTSN
jgi:putative FmdB family regulatory protein